MSGDGTVTLEEAIDLTSVTHLAAYQCKYGRKDVQKEAFKSYMQKKFEEEWLAGGHSVEDLKQGVTQYMLESALVPVVPVHGSVDGMTLLAKIPPKSNISVGMPVYYTNVFMEQKLHE